MLNEIAINQSKASWARAFALGGQEALVSLSCPLDFELVPLGRIIITSSVIIFTLAAAFDGIPIFVPRVLESRHPVLIALGGVAVIATVFAAGAPLKKTKREGDRQVVGIVTDVHRRQPRLRARLMHPIARSHYFILRTTFLCNPY